MRTQITLQKKRKLLDNFDSRIRSLKTLGIGLDMYGVMLMPILESKLPEIILLEYSRSFFEENLFSIENLIKFLDL